MTNALLGEPGDPAFGHEVLQVSTENSYTSGIHILDDSGLKGNAMHGQQLHEAPVDQRAGDGAVHNEFGGLPAGVRAERPEGGCGLFTGPSAAGATYSRRLRTRP